jgi:hypothetical protein
MKIITIIVYKRTQFSGCSQTINANSETVHTAFVVKILALGAFCSSSALFLLVGELFKKFGLFLIHLA